MCYGKSTNKLKYGGICIRFCEDEYVIGCGGDGEEDCEWQTSHWESDFFQSITNHI